MDDENIYLINCGSALIFLFSLLSCFKLPFFYVEAYNARRCEVDLMDVKNFELLKWVRDVY